MGIVEFDLEDLKNDSNIKETLEKFRENKVLDEEKKTKEELILFVSFDLVNSTKFKIYNNRCWITAIKDIIDSIRKGVSEINEKFQLWRAIGDELVFTIAVKNELKLCELVQDIYELLNRIYINLKNGEIFKELDEEFICSIIDQNILSIKSTAWIALVTEKDNNGYNVKYEYEPKYINEKGLNKIIEFQGNDIDAGFRVAKKCNSSRRLTLSVELAYILSRSKHIVPKIHIVGYKKLKGIWNDNPYPIIWYHDEYVYGANFDKSFFYNEEFENEVVKEYLKEKKDNPQKWDSERLLHKIVLDRNLKFKIGKLLKNIKNLSGEEVDTVIAKAPEEVEIHCVAVCKKSDGKVLMVKRAVNPEDKFSGLWEFGCSKMVARVGFREILKKDYKNNFNIEIELKNPFADYEFQKDGKKISGIRYLADIKESDNLEILNKKYVSYKFIDLEEFHNMPRKAFIDYDQFEKILKMIKNGKGYIDE